MPAKRFSPVLLAAMVFAVVCMAVTFPAQAQQPQQNIVRMPSPSKEESPAIVMQYFALIVIAAAAIGANLIPSKRGHQD